ncbi:uncharacterized protein LOC135225163 isoform X1 [Macrobrachium nipponense]|uniref:uncharacterized protein LOC135225163 isoform X1 n=1 Tax=Macrobrachium nipponense TaxID=159736 RepID=UPI0030C835E1
MTSPTTHALIGGVEPSLCRVMSHLAEKYGKLFLPWSCLEIPRISSSAESDEKNDSSDETVLEKPGDPNSPPTSTTTTTSSTKTGQVTDSDSKDNSRAKAKELSSAATGSHVAMVTPTARQMARGVFTALGHFGWKHISIITLDSRYWRALAHFVDVELRAWQRLVPALLVLPDAPTQANITALFEVRAKRIIKAYLLVLPSSSPLISRVLEEAEKEGVTRLAAFFIVDPFYAPSPIPRAPTAATAPAPSSGGHHLHSPNHQNFSHPRPTPTDDSRQNTSRPMSPRRSSPLASELRTKRFQSLRQFLNASFEATRSVMILAPVTRGPPNPLPPAQPRSSKPPSSKAQERPAARQDGQQDPEQSSGDGQNHVYREGKGQSEGIGQSQDRGRLEGSTTAFFNHSGIPETEMVLTRLVFDSISLLSHLLRANVGAFRLRRKSSGHRNSTSEESTKLVAPRSESYNNTMSNINNNSSSNNSAVSRAQRRKRRRRRSNNNKAAGKSVDRSRRSDSVSELFEWDGVLSRVISERDSQPSEDNHGLLIRDLKGDLYFTEEVAEKERLYFEMKKLNTEREGHEFEKKLESIIGSSWIKENGFNRHRKKEGELNKSQPIEMKVKRPTFFPSFWGEGFVSVLGERSYDFLLLDWDPKTKDMATVLELIDAPSKRPSKIGSGEMSVRTIRPVDWAHNVPIPRDKDCGPTVCGYTVPGGSVAPGYVVMIVMCMLFLFGACCAAAAVLRKRLRQKEMSRGPYKILLTSADLTLTSRPESAPRKVGDYVCIAGCVLSVLPGSGTAERPDLLRGSFSSPQRANHDNLLNNLPNAVHKDHEDAKAKYNGDFVHLRYFYHQGNFEVKNRTITLLKQMHDLRHENVNGFLGMLCDPVRPGFVFEYCTRRSLEDVIRQEDIKLDWSFRLSLLTDLVRGMRYLHGSPLRHHGRLTSRNCVIDARWVLKVTDYGLPGIYDTQNISQPKRPTRDLLWKAPEQLRDEGLLLKGSQAADVFSFSIIMQEVVVRGGPYCMVQLTHQEIIARLKKPPPMIRPSVSKGAAPPDAINIMKQCWAELPEMRPDFNQINDLFKKLNQGRRLNIVDTMFQMLEKYSSNLEELIRDRTEQLDLEKKKTEQLLNRMLPSSVANQLKLGMPVAPEEFDEVTIYFSDIVGFTSISAYSTPFEVVDLLNDLYTAFDSTINHYNVYKVETIGDAYMVVSGLPSRIDDHAAQIATMALDLLHLSGKFRIRHLHNIPLMVRIGIHTGPCCAGVVGMTMPRYCLFGDTVNTASRMESTGSAWRIHISEQTSSVLKEAGGYHLEYRGLTKLKGKGEMPTYWLLGKDDFKKELPAPPEIGLDEELIRLGRQHYMNRRDSTVESLTGIKGFSSIHAAKMQTDPQEACSSVMAEAERASCSSVNEFLPRLPTVQQNSSESEECLQSDHEPKAGEPSYSDSSMPNGRTQKEPPNIVVKESNTSAKDVKSSSTKSVSKSNCIRSKSDNAMPKKEVCDSVAVPKMNSKDQHVRHKRSASRPSVPSTGVVQNHIPQVPVIELQGRTVISKTSVSCPDTPRNRAVPASSHRVVSKSNSADSRSHIGPEELEEMVVRGSSCSPGPRRESCRGSSPPLLCHNKIYPHQGGPVSPIRDLNRPLANPGDSWRPHQRQQETGVPSGKPTSLHGMTAECEVHPCNVDPPSPTESTML